jgi:hypothetical protein
LTLKNDIDREYESKWLHSIAKSKEDNHLYEVIGVNLRADDSYYGHFELDDIFDPHGPLLMSPFNFFEKYRPLSMDEAAKEMLNGI